MFNEKIVAKSGVNEFTLCGEVLNDYL